jgi:hypothetical protein
MGRSERWVNANMNAQVDDVDVREVAAVVVAGVVTTAVVASAEAAPMTNAYLNADGCVCALELSASRW